MKEGLLQTISRHPDVFAMVLIALRLASAPHAPGQILRISGFL